ncbi:MAG: amidohydrolase family protein [Chryseolinea sp.]
MTRKLLLAAIVIVAPLLTKAQYTLISNTNLADVSKGKIITGASVLIKEGNIEEVFTNKKYKLPPGTTVFDGTGKYIMPGMTDAHIHFCQSGGLYTRPDGFNFTKIVPYEVERKETFNNTGDFLTRYLRMGITTVADVGGPFTNFAIRDSISRLQLSPGVLVTGPLFSMVEDKPLDNGAAPIVKTTTIEEADALFDKMLPLKPDYIKIWYIVTPDLPAEKTFPVVQHIAKRTHDAKLKLAVHATELKTAELAVDAGADILVHSVEDEIVTDQFVKKLVNRKVSYIPTLIVMDGYYRTLAGKQKNDPMDLRYANPFVFGSLTDPEHIPTDDLPERFRKVRSMTTPLADPNAHDDSVRAVNLRKVFAAGVNVVAGTDAGNVGTMHATSLHRELEAMKQAGLTEVDILKTVTLNSSACFNQNNGLIAKGKKADLLILSKNPFDNIVNLNSIEHLVKSGNLVKADTLIHETPEMLIQRQLNAYNARDIEAFLDTYSDSIELFDFPNTPIGSGKELMRSRYGKRFSTLRYLHCEIVDRIKYNNVVIDHELVKADDKVTEAVVIYEVKDGKIAKMTFKR